jgi:hypothetical protein
MKMKSMTLKLAALICFLLLLVSVGFGEKVEKVPLQDSPSKEKVKEPIKAEKAKPQEAGASEASGEKTRTLPQIKPVEQQSVPVQSVPVLHPTMVPQTKAQPAPTFRGKGSQIKWQVLSTGGTKGNSSSYQIGNAVSQTAIGCGGSSSHQLCQGFLVGSYGGGGFVRGDATGDGVIDAGDVVYMINYLYRGGYPPDPLEAGDTTCDGNVDAGDVVYLVNYLYRNGPAPSC